MELNSNTRVYISGCGGMLGHAVYSLFCEKTIVKATDIDLNSPWLSYADVRNYQEMADSIKDFGPDIIINLAALTDLEYCELHEEDSWLTNTLGAENLSLLANELDIPLVYISTAGIVDGKSDAYSDFGSHSPLSIYAKSKYEGELFVRASVRKHFIFRAGWMMGGGPKLDKKFVNKIYQQIKSGSEELFIVNDKLGTPTYTKSFAAGMFEVIKTDLYGVYNQVCEGDCSRLEVAREFVRLLGIENKIVIHEVPSEHFTKEYFAPRPESEKLVNMKLKARNINFMPHWKDALAEYTEEFIRDLSN